MEINFERNVLRNLIFMQKSFVYFSKKYLKDLQSDSFFYFILSSFLKIGLNVAVLGCLENLFKDMSLLIILAK